MREDNHDIQTPKKEHLPVASSSNRMAKQMNVASKKIHHQPQKDDSVLSLSEKEQIEKFSLISESVDLDQSTVEISRLSSASDKTLVLDKSLVLEHPEELIEISPISEA